MSRKMESETCKRKRLSSDISEEMDNDFYKNFKQWNLLKINYKTWW